MNQLTRCACGEAAATVNTGEGYVCRACAVGMYREAVENGEVRPR